MRLPVSAQSIRLAPIRGPGNVVVGFLIVGHGTFGAAIARHLAPHAKVTVVGPVAGADGSGVYGAHHDEGRIIGDLSRDLVWSELNRRARDGMAGLDQTLITPCGALTAAAPDTLTVAARLRERQSPDIQTLTADAARAGFPMARFRPDETILYQPAAGHFSPRCYVTLATQSAQGHGATITSGTVRAPGTA